MGRRGGEKGPRGIAAPSGGLLGGGGGSSACGGITGAEHLLGGDGLRGTHLGLGRHIWGRGGTSGDGAAPRVFPFGVG